MNKFNYKGVEIKASNTDEHEANLLQLNCDKAKQLLNWKPKWNTEQALDATAVWYKEIAQGTDACDVTRKQFLDYFG